MNCVYDLICNAELRNDGSVSYGSVNDVGRDNITRETMVVKETTTLGR